MQGERTSRERHVVSKKVASAAWGLLLIWMGMALLLRWSWGISLVGAGVILLGAQAARRYLRIPVEGFGLVAGLLLVLCGVWNMFEVALDLVPLLCIGAGIALLASVWRSKGERRASDGHELHASAHPRA